MHKNQLFALALGAGLLASSAVYAADLEGRVLRVGSDTTYPPMETVDETTGEILTDVPDPDALFWYLVRGGTAGGEGPVGDASSGPRAQESFGDCP